MQNKDKSEYVRSTSAGVRAFSVRKSQIVVVSLMSEPNKGEKAEPKISLTHQCTSRSMGAAVGVELNKPVNGSDILASESLLVARDEVVRLRLLLGHLAKENGFSEVVYDASDLVKGVSEKEDFTRCLDEIIHIRKCLQLSTQTTKRKERMNMLPATIFTNIAALGAENNDDVDDSDSSSDSEVDEVQKDADNIKSPAVHNTEKPK
jgi:hypothetical protein